VYEIPCSLEDGGCREQFNLGKPMEHPLRFPLFALMLLLGGVPPCAAADAPLRAGTWHEIARYPNFFERKCARNVTATYSSNADSTIRVVNACRKDDGSMMQAEGVARVVTSPSKLKVRFAPDWLAWLPFVWANYWVIDLADDYSYAVVGEPGREYLWILARAPQMSDGVYARIVARLPALGFDPRRLVPNP
jgi:apolipoprotein D and lipocalin family protein